MHKHKNAEVRVYGINKILTNILVIVKSEGVLVKSEGYFWNILWKKKNDDTMTGMDTTKVRPIELILRADD